MPAPFLFTVPVPVMLAKENAPVPSSASVFVDSPTLALKVSAPLAALKLSDAAPTVTTLPKIIVSPSPFTMPPLPMVSA